MLAPVLSQIFPRIQLWKKWRSVNICQHYKRMCSCTVFFRLTVYSQPSCRRSHFVLLLQDILRSKRSVTVMWPSGVNVQMQD